MRTTGLLPIEQEAIEASVRQFETAREEVLQELREFFESVVVNKLQQAPIWHKYVFGDNSFCDDATECVLLVSHYIEEDGLETDEMLHETIKELLRHTSTWLIWQRLCKEQSIGFTEPEKPAVPERPPDTTGPAPKPKRGLLGRRVRPQQLNPPDADTSVESAHPKLLQKKKK